MRRLLVALPLLFLSTPAFAFDFFWFWRDHDRNHGSSYYPPRDRKPPAVPEPTAALLFAAGAGLVGWRVGRRQR